MAKYTRDRNKLLDWIETNREIKERTKENFTTTEYAFKLYNQAHPDRQYYQPSEMQKQGESIFVGGSAFALAYAAFCLFELFAGVK